jgi:hypothetical protein
MPLTTTRPGFTRSTLPMRAIAGLLICLPMLVWLWTLSRYALNVVHDDDYTLLVFVARWTNPATTWATRLTDLVALHNTHRIVYDRLVALGTYYLTGRIDFRLMIALGNLALAGIGWQLWRGFRQLELPIWYFLPVPWWLFSLQSHENMFWSMAALQNFTVIWLVLETLHQLHRRTPLVWPLLLAIAATLTSGNGLLAFLVGVPVLLNQPRRERALAIWGVVTVVGLGLMLGVSPVSEQRTSPLVWLPNASLLLGAGFTNQLNTALPTLGGALPGVALLLALAAWLTQRGPLGQRLRQVAVSAEWLAFGLVLLATALLLAMHRTPDELLRDRYKIYAHLSLSIVYLLSLATFGPRSQRFWVMGATLVAVAMNALAYHACLPRIVGGFQDRQADAFNFQHNGTTLAAPFFRDYNDSLLHALDRQGIYRLPQTFAAPTGWATQKSADSLTIRTYQNDAIGNVFIGMHPHFVQIDNKTLARRVGDNSERGVYVVAEQIGKPLARPRRFLFAAPPIAGSLRPFLSGKGLFAPGFSITFLSSRLEPGRYRIKLWRGTTNEPALLDPGQTVQIPIY